MEIGWSELLVIGIVALIVIGPKDLPEMFRTLGRFTAKMRAMARDFSTAMEDAAKQSGVKDVADDLRKATDMKNSGLDAVKSAADKFEKWDPLKAAKSAQNFSPKAMAGNAVKSAVLGSGAAAGVAAANAAQTAEVGQTPAPSAPFDVELPPPLAKSAAPEPVSVEALPVQDLSEIMAQVKTSDGASRFAKPEAGKVSDGSGSES